MEFNLTEDQRAIQDMTREFAAAEHAPHAARWDEEKIFPIEALRVAAAPGLAGIYIQEDVGRATQAARSRPCSGSTAMPLGLHESSRGPMPA
jgi:alkylation response protein AidB-like acyl-CoA dehydrogenase